MTLEYQIKSDISKKKRLKWFGHVITTNNASDVNHSHAKTTYPTEDQEDNDQSDGLT